MNLYRLFITITVHVDSIIGKNILWGIGLSKLIQVNHGKKKTDQLIPGKTMNQMTQVNRMTLFSRKIGLVFPDHFAQEMGGYDVKNPLVGGELLGRISRSMWSMKGIPFSTSYRIPSHDWEKKICFPGFNSKFCAVFQHHSWWNCPITMERSTFFMAESTISMAIFNSKLLV